MNNETLKLARIDTLIGCMLSVLIAACMVTAGASLFGHITDVSNLGPDALISGFYNYIGQIPSIIFAIGLFNAGLLTSITISLSSSWTVAEALGWSKSLNDTPKTAPKFYSFYIINVVLAALAILIPNLPLNFISVGTQALGGILMAPILIFLLILTNKKELMGKYKNTLQCNIRSIFVTAVIIGMAILLLIQNFIS